MRLPSVGQQLLRHPLELPLLLSTCDRARRPRDRSASREPTQAARGVHDVLKHREALQLVHIAHELTGGGRDRRVVVRRDRVRGRDERI